MAETLGILLICATGAVCIVMPCLAVAGAVVVLICDPWWGHD